MDSLKYASKLSKARSYIKYAKESNTKLERYQKLLDEALDLSKTARAYLNALKITLDITQKESQNLKETRQFILEQEVTNVLSTVFEGEQFRAKLDVNTNLKTKTADLTLISRNGYRRKPVLSNGKCAQQVVSFSVVKSVLDFLDCDLVVLDEAFASSDRENLLKLSKLLSDTAKEKQIILVEHKEEIYKNLPRREIRLTKDVQAGEVNNVCIVDL